MNDIQAVIFDFYGVLVTNADSHHLSSFWSDAPNEALISFIEQELKPRYKIGLLSNSAGRHQLDAHFAPGRLDEIFDEVVSTGEIGFMKPQPEAYEYVAAKLGMLTDECVLVDDIEAYCTAAREVGMEAVQFRTTKQSIHSITTILDEKGKKV